ncbi:MAG: hypothetical protein ABIF40_05670 [archaeon]
MEIVKGIRFEYKSSPQLVKLLKDYRKAVNLYLTYCKETKKTSRGGINEIQ